MKWRACWRNTAFRRLPAFNSKPRKTKPQRSPRESSYLNAQVLLSARTCSAA
jgi:hypothetical protein